MANPNAINALAREKFVAPNISELELKSPNLEFDFLPGSPLPAEFLSNREIGAGTTPARNVAGHQLIPF